MQRTTGMEDTVDDTNGILRERLFRLFNDPPLSECERVRVGNGNMTLVKKRPEKGTIVPIRDIDALETMSSGPPYSVATGTKVGTSGRAYTCIGIDDSQGAMGWKVFCYKPLGGDKSPHRRQPYIFVGISEGMLLALADAAKDARGLTTHYLMREKWQGHENFTVMMPEVRSDVSINPNVIGYMLGVMRHRPEGASAQQDRRSYL